ncbi:MAG: TetR/AcrR family transcriptional regulator [Leptospiraceae bacterium]|nr:TetR/AcrR family transcriptional regulator [Leptospiraceae bacterium]
MRKKSKNQTTVQQSQQNVGNSPKFLFLSKSLRDLIYRNGFYRTGMRDFAKNAEMSLSNLYVYFKSKDDIGLHHIEEEEKDQISKLEALMRLNPEPKKFFRVWLISKRTDARKGNFIGCPFSSFSYQTEKLDSRIQNSIQNFTNVWEKLLSSYIDKAIINKYLSVQTNSSLLAKRILSYYQGTVAMWRMSHNNAYWKVLEELIYEDLDQNSI